MRDTEGSCDNFTSSSATHTYAKKKEGKKNSKNRKPLKRVLETEVKRLLCSPSQVMASDHGGSEECGRTQFSGVWPISSEYMGSMYWTWYIFLFGGRWTQGWDGEPGKQVCK